MNNNNSYHSYYYYYSFYEGEAVLLTRKFTVSNDNEELMR